MRHTEFRLDDKVIQQKNDYEKDVYNGDIGFIRNINFNLQGSKVDFGDKVITYSKHINLNLRFLIKSKNLF